jgi:pre-mRNA-splicing factor CWC26
LTREREAKVFAKMDSQKSGKDAKTIHRDKSGRKRDLEAEEEKKKEKDRKKAIDDEKFKDWGRG